MPAVSWIFVYLSPSHIAPHHRNVDLDDRPRDVGVFGGVENYSKMGIYWGGGVEFFSYLLSGCTLLTGYTHLGDKV